jgi:hypothetical protein
MPDMQVFLLKGGSIGADRRLFIRTGEPKMRTALNGTSIVLWSPGFGFDLFCHSPKAGSSGPLTDAIDVLCGQSPENDRSYRSSPVSLHG